MMDTIDNLASNFTAFSELSNDGYDNTSVSVSPSPNRKAFPVDVQPVTVNLNKRDHEENNGEISDLNKVKHNLFEKNLANGINERSSQTANNLATMIHKVRSLVILIVVICLVILLFISPIILYFTGPSTDESFVTFHVDPKTCSVRFYIFTVDIHILHSYDCHITMYINAVK